MTEEGQQTRKRFRFRIFHNAPARFIVAGFLLIIFAGAFLLSLPIANTSGTWLNFADSLFTSVSAVCITGMIVAETAVQFSLFGQIVILLLVQIGGLGFMAGAMLFFLVAKKRITLSERIVLQESLNHFKLQGIVKTVKEMLIYVFIVELAGAAILMFTFIPEFGAGNGIYMSVFHSVSAFCNAGFDLFGNLNTGMTSLQMYAQNPAVIVPIGLLIILGGIGYIVIKDVCGVFRHRKISLYSKIILIGSAVLIVAGFAGFCALEWNRAYAGQSTGGKLLSAFFQSVSVRTAGFNTVDQAALTNGSVILSGLLMFIGAAPSSTGGGVKITTIAVLFAIVSSNLRGRAHVSFAKSNINEQLIKKTVTILFIAISTILLSAFAISIIERSATDAGIISLTDIIYDTISSFDNVGMSRGAVMAGTKASRLILALCMFIGRVGILTLGTAIASGAKTGGKAKYTDAKILIG